MFTRWRILQLQSIANPPLQPPQENPGRAVGKGKPAVVMRNLRKRHLDSTKDLSTHRRYDCMLGKLHIHDAYLAYFAAANHVLLARFRNR